MANPNGSPSPPLTDPPIVPITPAEYPGYYFQRHGRLYPILRLPPSLRNNTAEVQLPSLLPVDPIDMERREVQHGLVHLILGHHHWFGPLGGRLTPGHGRIVVDIGSVNGKWADEVWEEFQDVRFHGIELVPMPPFEHSENITYEVYDFQQEGIRQGSSTVDVIHARFQNVQITDWPAFLKDVARALKPGGLFMSGEIDLSLEGPDGEVLPSPATTQLYNRVQNMMHERGYRPDIGTIMPGLLNGAVDADGAALFTNVDSQIHTFPVGGGNPDPDLEQREISALAMEMLDRQASSLRPLLLSTGQAEVEIDGLIYTHRQELREMNARMKYRISWAERC